VKYLDVELILIITEKKHLMLCKRGTQAVYRARSEAPKWLQLAAEQKMTCVSIVTFVMVTSWVCLLFSISSTLIQKASEAIISFARDLW